MNGVLDPALRRATLDGLGAGPAADVLVIGGGVTGAGAALDAASRGLSTVLVEQDDWASGTSSRSSKLIHGGLRYLEMLDVGLVREALRERGLLVKRLAPHLVRPIPFLFPLAGLRQRAYVGAGVLLYDALSVTSSGRGLPLHRHLSHDAALRAAPALRSDAFAGGVQYWDALVDDARHTLTVVRTAAQHGARVLNRARVTALLRDGERVTGARCTNVDDGTVFTVRARCTIAAAGVWSDGFSALADAPRPFRVRASKGVHIVVPRACIPAETGIILRTALSVLFVIPWNDRWIVGTTDTDVPFEGTQPAASAGDVDYLLTEINRVLVRPLTRADIDGVYAGLRPLIARGDGPSAKVPRTHTIASPRPGLTAVAGGKYTTYRVMAADAVDAALREAGIAAARSRTAHVPLAGADGFFALRARAAECARAYGLPEAAIAHLLARYGALTADVLAPADGDPAASAALPGGAPYLRAEVRYACTHEDARHLEDVMVRRTRLAFEAPDGGLAAAPAVAEIMAAQLGWTPAERDRQLRAYAERAGRERAALRASP